MKTYMAKNRKQGTSKKDKKEIMKIIEVNNQFAEQIKEIKEDYPLTDLQQQNLEHMIQHYENLNDLFRKFQK